jgi:hypothetical protein
MVDLAGFGVPDGSAVTGETNSNAATIKSDFCIRPLKRD